MNDPFKGIDVSINKLYIQSDGTLKGKTTWAEHVKFTVTMVRPNIEKK